MKGVTSVVQKIKAKLFWRLGDTSKKVISISYDETKNDYYSFLKKQFEAGYRQIIISSEVMIEIINHAVLSEGLKISEVLLSEDDDDAQTEIAYYLDLISKNPAHFGSLVSKLAFLSDNSSIDIQRIAISGRTADKRPVECYIQSNGIFAINSEMYEYLEKKLRPLIERCIFG